MVKLNAETYKKLIEADIDWLDKVHQDYSLEKSHIKQVLMDSIKEISSTGRYDILWL